MEYWPQYVYLAITFLGTGMIIADHGKPRKNENAYTSITATIIALYLLASGGFFKGVF